MTTNTLDYYINSKNHSTKTRKNLIGGKIYKNLPTHALKENKNLYVNNYENQNQFYRIQNVKDRPALNFIFENIKNGLTYLNWDKIFQELDENVHTGLLGMNLRKWNDEDVTEEIRDGMVEISPIAINVSDYSRQEFGNVIAHEELGPFVSLVKSFADSVMSAVGEFTGIDEPIATPISFQSEIDHQRQVDRNELAKKINIKSKKIMKEPRANALSPQQKVQYYTLLQNHHVAIFKALRNI